MHYDWPGNVRELESVVRKALMNATGPVIVPEFLPAGIRDPLVGRLSKPPSGPGPFHSSQHSVPGGPNVVRHSVPYSASHGNQTALGGNQTARGGNQTANGGPGNQTANGGDLAPFIEERLHAGTTSLYAETVEMMERYLITRVMQATHGNQSKAAELLGISRGTIRSRLSSFRISLDRVVHTDGAGA